MKKISIITVCYNCENDVKFTLESICEQTFDDFELIIVDGNSSDNTLNEVNKYSEKIQNFKLISEKDKGIYDAMNKGVNMSDGEYIIFMNMGDKFVNKHVLENVSQYLTNDKTIYYGDFILKNKPVKGCSKLSDIYFLLEKTICHQTIFAPKKSLIDYPFDIKFKLCADRDWIICTWKKKIFKFKHVNELIAYYDGNGLSSNNEKVSKESKKILSKYYHKKIIDMIYLKNKIGMVIKGKKKYD